MRVLSFDDGTYMGVGAGVRVGGIGVYVRVGAGVAVDAGGCVDVGVGVAVDVGNCVDVGADVHSGVAENIGVGACCRAMLVGVLSSLKNCRISGIATDTIHAAIPTINAAKAIQLPVLFFPMLIL